MIRYLRLEDLCSDVIDCPHSTPIWKDSGVRVVRNFNLKNGRLDFSDGYFVDEETYIERIKRACPEEGDIIISREAPMGVAAIVPANLKCCLGQRLVLLKVDKSICNPHYLLAALLSSYVQTQFQRADATGSIVSNLCIPDLKSIVIPIDEERQDIIADFYEKINRKLEINSAINDNLYQMAHTLYMHSFFNRPTNGKLGDIIIEHAKSAVQVGDAKDIDGDYPFFTSGDAVLKWTEPLADGRNCFLNTGGNAGVKFYVGKSAYSTDSWCITASNNLSDYLYLLLDCIRPELTQKYFQGTGLKHLQKPLLKDRPIYIPSEGEMEIFNKSVQPWLSMISDNIRESQQLTSLRDWLLPMLMNGQATITD